MAELTEVEQALVNLIAGAIYPNGTSQPSTIVLASGRNADARIFSGWPTPADLDADLAEGVPPGSTAVVEISVFSPPGLEKNVSRYFWDWIALPQVAPTIQATVSGQTVTLSGTVTAGNYVSIITANRGFSYICLSTDTLASVAVALVALVQATKVNAYAIGPVITFPTRNDIVAVSAAPTTQARELKRQMRRFQITIWASNNDARQAAVRVIEPLLASTNFLLFPDSFTGRLIYENANDIDRSGKQSLMCRDMFWWVEYPTTQSMPAYPITIPGLTLTGNSGTPYNENPLNPSA